MKDFSYLSNSHPEYIENLYETFRENPENVDKEYRKFFEGFDFAVDTNADQNYSNSDITEELKVASLIVAYRSFGHLIADTNPIRNSTIGIFFKFSDM